MRNFISTTLLLLLLTESVSSQTLGKETFLIETPLGNMKVKLYEETPLHKANFTKLVKSHYFDSLLFHRVIHNFMIQGGDHLSKTAKPGDSLGHGEIGYTIPAEFNSNLIHQKGRLCAARESDDINPNQESSPSQFYLVMGKVRTLEDLKRYENRINTNKQQSCKRAFEQSDKAKTIDSEIKRHKLYGNMDSLKAIESLKQQLSDKACANLRNYTFNQHQITTYTTIGGTPHLDGSYTVFGEVIEGIEVIELIAAVETDKRDRPIKDIRMKIKLLEE